MSAMPTPTLGRTTFRTSGAGEIDLPDDLVDRVRAFLEEHPEEPGDGAVASLVDHALAGAGPDHRSSRAPPE